MIITKILNNNAVVCLDGKEEVVVRGKGISFGKRTGEQINKKMIEKIYKLDNHVQTKFEELISNISINYLEISDEIIKYANSYLDKTLNDIIYISLIDHIALAVERTKKGVAVLNPLLMEIRKYYPNEYYIGLYAIKKINERESINLGEDEAGFIALHIVNAQTEGEEQIAYDMTKLIREVLNIVRLRFNIIYNEDSVFYYRFVTHLKFFAHRLFMNQHYYRKYNNELIDIIKENYKKSYECVQYITSFINKVYNYSLSEDEQVYLTIHIEKIVDECRKEEKGIGK